MFTSNQKQWWCKRFGWHPSYDCDDVLSNSETIEIAVWHRDRANAARVIREYAEAAATDAWGDRYDIKVWLSRQSLPDDMTPDETFGWVRDESKVGYGYRAKDANLVCLPHADAVGGGSVCLFGVDTALDSDPDVADLWVRPNTGKPQMKPEVYACGPPYGKISSALHEMGHCFGLGHDVGGTVTNAGQSYVTPMPYIDLDCYYLRYSDEAIAVSPNVQ